MGVAGAASGVVVGKLLTLPVHRWRQAMEARRAAILPTAESILRTGDDGGATAADAAFLYLEAVISAAFEATAGEIDAELAGRCLLAEDVLYLLTGSSDIDDVREWIDARGLDRR